MSISYSRFERAPEERKFKQLIYITLYESPIKPTQSPVTVVYIVSRESELNISINDTCQIPYLTYIRLHVNNDPPFANSHLTIAIQCLI